MTLKTRLKKLEAGQGSDGPEVFINRTYYEERDGGQTEGFAYAMLYWGPDRAARAETQEGETFDAFGARVESYKGTPWSEAAGLDGVIFYESQQPPNYRHKETNQ